MKKYLVVYEAQSISGSRATKNVEMSAEALTFDTVKNWETEIRQDYRAFGWSWDSVTIVNVVPLEN